jgi:pimeloyl-ACP methyl ester carboxylesterase
VTTTPARLPVNKSTIVRAEDVPWRLRALRAIFGTLERAAPALGARLAERLWFTIPTRTDRRGAAPPDSAPPAAPPPDAPPPGAAPPGTPLTLRLYGRWMVGRAWGEGPVVQLVHGWGGRRADLEALVEPLVTAGYRVVAFDAPGHGESERGESGRRRATLLEAADLVAAVDAAYGPVHAIVAHSAGCMATAVALRRGLAVTRLVFFAPMGDLAQYTSAFALAFDIGDRTLHRFVRRVERRVGSPVSYFDLPTMTSEIARPPLLLLHDRADRETRHADSTAIAGAWPDARLITTTGLGHRRILRDPEAVREAVAFVADGAEQRIMDS